MDATIDLELNNALDHVVDAVDPSQGLRLMGYLPRLSSLLCPICEGPCHYHTPDNLTLCRRCGHVFQTDMAITVSYDSNYAHRYDAKPVKEMSNVRWRFIQKFLELPRGSKILDIGYGNGAFLKRAREEGMDVYGIDVHSEDFGIPSVAFDSPLNFDLVCFFDSLEHFPTFRDIFKLTSGTIIVSIPNIPDLLLATPHAWRHYKPGEHLHYFSRKSLGILLHRLGYGVKLTDGFPEDELRGKLPFDQQQIDNIYTTIHARSTQTYFQR